MGTWVGLSCVALALWGITGVTQKLSTNKISSLHSFVWFSGAFVLVAAVLLAFVPLGGQLSVTTIALAALGGLLNGGGALSSFAAFERGWQGLHRDPASLAVSAGHDRRCVAVPARAGDGRAGSRHRVR